LNTALEVTCIKLIEVDKKLPEETVRKFGYELVEGLSYLHANGIIYSDLKPSNIMINEYGVLEVLRLRPFQENNRFWFFIRIKSGPKQAKIRDPLLYGT